MSAPTDGGPAFPGEDGVSGYGACKPIEGPNGITWLNLNAGMSLRAYFAGQVLPALPLDNLDSEDAASRAVDIADALIAELSKPKGK